MKNMTKPFGTAIICALALFTVTSCNSDPSSVTFVLPELGNEVEIHQEHQAAYLKNPNPKSEGNFGFAPKEEYCKPIPVRLSWKVTSAKEYTIEVSETEDFSDSWIFSTKNKYYDVYNLKVNTTYYWKVAATYPSNEFTSDVASFKTTKYAPRNIYLDGVKNVRDIGGKLTSFGTTVKQGMVYRCAQLNEDYAGLNKPNITSKGIEMNEKYLKIKTDIDVRKNFVEESHDGKIENNGLDYSPLGEDVTYKSLPIAFNQNILEHPTHKEMNYASIKAFFETLADEASYPLLYHCTRGRDRTGLLSFTLGALLGVDYDDLLRDYIFTNFAQIDGYCTEDEIMGTTFRYIAQMDGEDIAEKAYNFLNLKIGVETTKLDKIRTILCE